MPLRLLTLSCCAVTLLGLPKHAPAGADATSLPAAANGTVAYERDIKPLFERNCLKCHGPEKHKGGLRLDRKADALAGGDSGRAFEPGKSAESLLVAYVAGLDPDQVMPPQGKRLSREEVGQIRAWIDQGASWPETSSAEANLNAAQTHWAFRPPVRHEAPVVNHRSWVRSPIDAFIAARLERERIEPSPEADRATLIRRLSLDLRGLPPTPEEVERFGNDAGPNAYERVVDAFLASPHYGERWGRHWLDLARYADSDGYEKDSPRPFAWRYREWVIDALNRDLPFDQFTAEQLAGDLLPEASLAQKTATGFHRNTLTNKEGGVDQEEYRVAAVVDRVNTTGTVWLGLTVGCAQCHSHKYDPISQREYYNLFAFFNTGQEVDLPTPLDGDHETFERAQKTHDTERLRRERLLAAAMVGRPLQETPGAFSRAVLTAHVNVLAHERKAPVFAPSKVQTLAEAPKSRKTYIHIRGDFLRKGDEVQPGTLAVLPPLDSADASRTRLDLAQWLTRPEHPLTARVAANRVWKQLFGRGLVATVDDFGTKGEPPSHPELLDWLALAFQELGWSQKALTRLIVTSGTYRQASASRPELADRDPNNVWLARQNRLRLEGEVIRDSSLAASGLLVPRIGGPSVRPPQPAGISELTYAGAARWVESQGPDRHRRGLYTWFQRTSPYPMLMTFDSPDSNVCAVKRERSNTPLQALTLLNDPVFFECAQALGHRILRESSAEFDARLQRGFHLCLARTFTADEHRVMVRLHERLVRQCESQPAEAVRLAGVSHADVAAWVVLARTMLNLDEFITRE